MVFSTYIFIFYFLPLVLAVYYALPYVARVLGGGSEFVSRVRNGWLLLASYVFYGWWDPWFILLMFFVTAANYVCGWVIAWPGAGLRQRRVGVTVAVVVSLSALGFFKVLQFFGGEPE